MGIIYIYIYSFIYTQDIPKTLPLPYTHNQFTIQTEIMSNEQISAKKLIKQAGIGQAERFETAKAAQNKLAADLAAIPSAMEKPLVDK